MKELKIILQHFIPLSANFTKRQSCHQLTDFYIMATSAFNVLSLNLVTVF